MFQHGLQLTFKHMCSVFRSSQQSALISSFCFQVTLFFSLVVHPIYWWSIIWVTSAPCRTCWEALRTCYVLVYHGEQSKARRCQGRERSRKEPPWELALQVGMLIRSSVQAVPGSPPTGGRSREAVPPPPPSDQPTSDARHPPRGTC